MNKEQPKRTPEHIIGSGLLAQLVAAGYEVVPARRSSDEQAEVVPDRIFKAAVRLYNHLNAPNPRPWADQSYDTQLKWRDAVRIVLDNAPPPAVAKGGVTAARAIVDEMLARDERNGFLTDWWRIKLDALNAALPTHPSRGEGE